MTAALLLCAGGSTRFVANQSKLLTPFRGRPLVSWALKHVSEAAFDEIFVVVGSVDLTGVVPATMTCVRNEAWASGQASSLICGVGAAERRGHEVVVVGLGDQPLVPAEAWEAVAAASGDIAIASFNGRRTPPTRLARSVWPLLPRTGDVGARALMDDRPDLVQEVPCPGESVDIDTADDLSRWALDPNRP
jgi:CTP:molybdopterin cytidylyltransferase MocA